MGFDFCCFNKENKFNSLNSFAPENEKEISVQKFHSKNDSFYVEIETKYNIFVHIYLIDYINLLENYSLQTVTLPFDGFMKKKYSLKESFWNYTMSVDEFQSFIENKLLKISEIYEFAGKNELIVSTFKTVFREIYNSLEFKLNEHYKEVSNKQMRKLTLVPFGILYAKSNVLGKIKLIFDLYKNKNEEFVKSEEFNEFLLASFLVSSYCMLSARKKISNSNQNIPKMKKEDMINCLKVCKLKDCQHLVKVFNDTFFEKEAYNWNEFKAKFKNKEKGFQWILSSRGIRQKLEENNV